MADQVPFQTLPFPPPQWSFQWASRLVTELRTILSRPIKLQRYTVAGVPSAVALGNGAVIYVTNESGGAVPAFSDGAVWRRVTDRSVIS